MTYETWRKQVEEGEQKPRQAEIRNVFLIDRGERADGTTRCSQIFFDPHNGVCVFVVDVDFVTPLCSQVVYEGLVDDIFKIKCGGY